LAIRVDLKRAKAMAEKWHSYGGVLDVKLCHELGLDVSKVRTIMHNLEESECKVPIPFYHGPTRPDENSGKDIAVLR
jgi:hypothetical protein